MSKILNDKLPEVLKNVHTQPLFVMCLDVRKLLIVGATPNAFRRLLFETSAPKYDWINRIAAIGIGHRQARRSDLQRLRSVMTN